MFKNEPLPTLLPHEPYPLFPNESMPHIPGEFVAVSTTCSWGEIWQSSPLYLHMNGWMPEEGGHYHEIWGRWNRTLEGINSGIISQLNYHEVVNRLRGGEGGLMRGIRMRIRRPSLDWWYLQPGCGVFSDHPLSTFSSLPVSLLSLPLFHLLFLVVYVHIRFSPIIVYFDEIVINDATEQLREINVLFSFLQNEISPNLRHMKHKFSLSTKWMQMDFVFWDTFYFNYLIIQPIGF